MSRLRETAHLTGVQRDVVAAVRSFVEDACRIHGGYGR